MIKIAFVGQMGAGKTYLADKLIDLIGGEKVSFASQLKKDIIDLNLTPDGKINKARDRKLLQDYGQFRRGELNFFETSQGALKNLDGVAWLIKDAKPEFIGKCYPSYWLDKGISQAKEISKNNNVCIDDVRFINEAEALKRIGFSIVKILSDEGVRISRLLSRDGGYDKENFTNISEMQFFDIKEDFLVDNNEDDIAFKNLVNIVETIKEKSWTSIK